MDTIGSEIRDFLAAKQQAQAQAAQLAALQILCGIDLSAVLASGAEARAAAISRIDRLLIRERMKGLARHWSYDLNRHIALKQASDRLKVACGVPKKAEHAGNENGARRRRRTRVKQTRPACAGSPVAQARAAFKAPFE